MRLILEFEKYRIIEDVVAEMSKIFAHVKMKGNVLYASSVLDGEGTPLVDPKKTSMGLLLQFGGDHVVIKKLIGEENEADLSRRIMDAFSKIIEPRYTIVVDQDFSQEFWDRMVEKYPQFKWIKK